MKCVASFLGAKNIHKMQNKNYEEKSETLKYHNIPNKFWAMYLNWLWNLTTIFIFHLFLKQIL